MASENIMSLFGALAISRPFSLMAAESDMSEWLEQSMAQLLRFWAGFHKPTSHNYRSFPFVQATVEIHRTTSAIPAPTNSAPLQRDLHNSKAHILTERGDSAISHWPPTLCGLLGK